MSSPVTDEEQQLLTAYDQAAAIIRRRKEAKNQRPAPSAPPASVIAQSVQGGPGGEGGRMQKKARVSRVAREEAEAAPLPDLPEAIPEYPIKVLFEGEWRSGRQSDVFAQELEGFGWDAADNNTVTVWASMPQGVPSADGVYKQRFSFNICPAPNLTEDVYYHFNPRAGGGGPPHILQNTKHKGKWNGGGDKKFPGFPIETGKLMEYRFLLTRERGVVVCLDGVYKYEFRLDGVEGRKQVGGCGNVGGVVGAAGKERRAGGQRGQRGQRGGNVQ